MNRADFWCRVLGWLQVVAGLALAAVILLLWRLVRDFFEIGDVSSLSILVWAVVFLTAMPTFFAGLSTIFFANTVEQARTGLRNQQKILLRVVMALCGLWSAGVIGIAGLSLPPSSLLAILGLATTFIAIMGADWVADLFQQDENRP